MSADQDTRSITFARSSQLDVPLTFRISTLEGKRPPRPLLDLIKDPTLRVAGVQQPGLSDLYVICQLWADNKPLTIDFKTAHKTFTTSYTWNEAIKIPVKIKDLPLSAQVTFTVYDTGPTSAAPEVVGGATLRLFGKKYTLRKGKQRLQLWRGVVADGSEKSRTPSKVPLAEGETDEMGRLEKLVKKYERGDFERVDWLDALVFRKIEQIHATESEKSDKLYLYVDLPRYDFPVVFAEMENPPYVPPIPAHTASSMSAAASGNGLKNLITPDFFTVFDPEAMRDNPVENKHLRLVRSHRSGPLDRELKPNAVTRDELTEILHYPPTQALTPHQRDLIWRYRFYLTRDKRALTKFLKSVVWSDHDEVKQAVEILLPSWTSIEIEDALELLGPGEAFQDRRVRGYAVKQVARADDDELMLYLLQLVQALKFEVPPHKTSKKHRAPQSSAFGSQSLEEFLIARSVKNKVLGNHFYWYMMVEMHNVMFAEMYKRVTFNFMTKISQMDGAEARRDEIRRQAEFVGHLSKIARDVRLSKDARLKKVDKLRSVIKDKQSHIGHFANIPLPLDAKVEIIGIDDEKSTVFKSNLFPLRLQLRTADGGEYPVIFKNGDDLRQDQLVIQLFTLMDRLLRKENLDLKIIAYKVLATANFDGMVQFVASKTLGAIASEYSTGILGYLRQVHPATSTSDDVLGVQKDVHDTFVRSCAGYCVLTYLLGVGDRHLDNLLLSPDGHFFHVDYGYILGRDPKPFAPAIKLSKEMVDGMGGIQSPHFSRFKNLCFTAFISLRKSANLILNLIALMVDANIADIALEPDKAVAKVQEKFRLDLTDEEAIAHIEGLLNETSSWASVLDRIHAAAQYMRQ